MEPSREDVSIAIRSALLQKGTQQRFSLLILVIISIGLLFLEKVEVAPINYVRSAVKDAIYRGSQVISLPNKGIENIFGFTREHINLYADYNRIKTENRQLKNKISNSNSDFLKLENTQLRMLIDEQVTSKSNFVSSRVLLDKESLYLNSFIINSGSNKEIKKGMAVLNQNNFIGRIVDVNFFSSRVLLISDLNSKIPVITEPSAVHAILSGRGGKKLPTLQYLPKNHMINNGDKVYTSGKEGIFSPGLPIGEVKFEDDKIKVNLLTDLSQITFVNVDLTNFESNE